MADKSVFSEIDYHKNCLEQLDEKKSKYFKDKSIPLEERFGYYKEHGGTTHFEYVSELDDYPLVQKMCKDYREYSQDPIYVNIHVNRDYPNFMSDFKFRTVEELSLLSPDELDAYNKTIALIDEAVSNDIGIVEDQY